MPPRGNMFDYAQRATSFGLLGLGIWGIWLTAAVWKSRRGEQGLMLPPGKLEDMEAVHARREADLQKAKMQIELREGANHRQPS